jgi:hypothetical protein
VKHADIIVVSSPHHLQPPLVSALGENHAVDQNILKASDVVTVSRDEQQTGDVLSQQLSDVVSVDLLPIGHISDVLRANNELQSWSNENAVVPDMSLLNACVVLPNYSHDTVSGVSFRDIVTLGPILDLGGSMNGKFQSVSVVGSNGSRNESSDVFTSAEGGADVGIIGGCQIASCRWVSSDGGTSDGFCLSF